MNPMSMWGSSSRGVRNGTRRSIGIAGSTNGNETSQVPRTVIAVGGRSRSLLMSHPKDQTCSMGPIVACVVTGMPHAAQKCDNQWISS
ncbi:MAG: hypothetical protein ACYTA3_13140 [Planctomycetota bacterium]